MYAGTRPHARQTGHIELPWRTRTTREPAETAAAGAAQRTLSCPDARNPTRTRKNHIGRARTRTQRCRSGHSCATTSSCPSGRNQCTTPTNQPGSSRTRKPHYHSERNCATTSSCQDARNPALKQVKRIGTNQFRLRKQILCSHSGHNCAATSSCPSGRNQSHDTDEPTRLRPTTLDTALEPHASVYCERHRAAQMQEINHRCLVDQNPREPNHVHGTRTNASETTDWTSSCPTCKKSNTDAAEPHSETDHRPAQVQETSTDSRTTTSVTAQRHRAAQVHEISARTPTEPTRLRPRHGSTALTATASVTAQRTSNCPNAGNPITDAL